MTFIFGRSGEEPPRNAHRFSGGLRVTQEPNRPIGLLPPRLLRLGCEQQAEAVELLAELLLDAAGKELARAAAPDRAQVAHIDISTHRESSDRVRRAA